MTAVEDRPAGELVLHPCTAAMRRELLQDLAVRGVGFMGCDPLVHSVAVMDRRLRRQQVSLFAAAWGPGGPGSAGLVGFAPAPRQGSQWLIDVVPSTAIDRAGGLIGRAAAFAATFLAARSLLRYGQVRDDRGPLFDDAGFVELGRLRAALYQDGDYRDQPVWFFGEATEGGDDHAPER